MNIRQKFEKYKGTRFVQDGCECEVVGYTPVIGGCLVGKVIDGDLGFTECEFTIYTPDYKLKEGEKLMFLVDL